MSMKIKLRVVNLVLILITVSGVSKSQDVLNLSRAINIALEKNLQLKQVKLGETLAFENFKASKLSLLPTINLNSGLSYGFGRNEDPFSSEFFNTTIASSSGGISVNIPLFQASSRFKLIAQNKSLLDISRNVIKRTENELVLNVMTSYLQVLFNREVSNASLVQLNMSKKMQEYEEKMYDVGDRSQGDLAQSKMQVALAETRNSNANNQLKLSYLNLASYLEIPYNSNFELAQMDQEVDFDKLTYYTAEVLEKAIQINPTVKISKSQTLVASTGVDISKTGLYPKLSLQAGMNSGFSSSRQRAFRNSLGDIEYKGASIGFQFKDNFNQYIGINLSMPILNGLAARTNINKAKLNLRNTQILEELESKNLKKVIVQAIMDLELATDHHRSATAAFNASKIAFEAIKKKYEVGLVNSLLLFQSQTNMNVTQIDLIKAKYDVIFKNKIINFYLGDY